MGFGRKVGAFLGLVPDDGRQPAGFEEDYPENQYEADYNGEYRGEFGADYGNERRGYNNSHGEEYPAPYAAGSADRRPAITDASSGFAPEPVTQGALAVQPRYEPRRDLDSSSKAATRPVTVKLASFTEARVIGEKYRDGQSVIMDMTDMADADARRLVDFAAGLAFARRGSIDKVTTKVFMLLPSDVSFDDVAMNPTHEYAGAYAR
jgi:cell division inhibitor SepF